LVLVNCWPPLRSRNETLTTLCPDIMMKMGKISELAFFSKFELSFAHSCRITVWLHLGCGSRWLAIGLWLRNDWI
jgi:hypothetical protein